MIKAVLYARVSSKDQEKEGYSIPAQLKMLREYTLKHGFTIVKEFIDVETANRLTGAKCRALVLFYARSPPRCQPRGFRDTPRRAKVSFGT